MAKKHVAEVLTEVDKKLTAVINKVQGADEQSPDTKSWIEDLNNIIRSLDHLVEELEK